MTETMTVVLITKIYPVNFVVDLLMLESLFTISKLSRSISSSSSNISIIGSLNDLVVMAFSKDNNNEGKNNKLANTASNSVMDTNKPRALVPPNSENTNMPNPKISTIKVQIILTPVSSKALFTDSLILPFKDFNS